MRFTPELAPTADWTGADGARHALTSGTDITLRAGAADPVVRIAGAPLVFAGYGISGPTWDDYGAADLTGKVVVVLRGQPASMGADPNFYGSTTHKMQEALKRGAVGVITLQGPGRPLASGGGWRGSAANDDQGRPGRAVHRGDQPGGGHGHRRPGAGDGADHCQDRRPWAARSI